jgi:hypothetical protein
MYALVDPQMTTIKRGTQTGLSMQEKDAKSKCIGPIVYGLLICSNKAINTKTSPIKGPYSPMTREMFSYLLFGST